MCIYMTATTICQATISELAGPKRGSIARACGRSDTAAPWGGCVAVALLGSLGGKTQRVPPRIPLPLIGVRPKTSIALVRIQVISQKVGGLRRIPQRCQPLRNLFRFVSFAFATLAPLAPVEIRRTRTWSAPFHSAMTTPSR